jgi:hypothetical protein
MPNSENIKLTFGILGTLVIAIARREISGLQSEKMRKAVQNTAHKVLIRK